MVKYLEIKSVFNYVYVILLLQEKIFVIADMLRILLILIQSSHWEKRDRSTGIFIIF